MQKIVPHLWYDKEAKEAAQFYTSVFKPSKLINSTQLHDTPSGSVDLITINLLGMDFMMISAGPYFKFTPAISFLVLCDSVDEVDRLWKSFSGGGKVLMPLDAYPFSSKYGWLEDKFGLSWQFMYQDKGKVGQKIIPSLLFVGDQCGRAEEAINFHTSIFRKSKINHIMRYENSEGPDQEGTVQHASYSLEGMLLAAMDSALQHQFTFNEAVSFIVNCKDQKEIDYYWDALSAVPEAEQCGWLKDKFGISWQITPVEMNKLMQNKDPVKLQRVTEAFLKMKKFDIAELRKAAR